MNKKWVDNEVYFGPDRRKREGGKRWGDRRHVNDVINEPPPLGALLRRLRVMVTDADDPYRRGRMLQILGLAIAEADQMHLRACSDRLLEVRRLVSTNAKGTRVQVDQLLTEAITIAQAPRDTLYP